MSFTDHKITQFAHKIADLPDQPNLPADELKARFDSSPEELRQGLNAVCDDAARLEARVEGIVVETFGDTINKSMLSTELAAELDAKATQAALAAETSAREALAGRVATAESNISTHTTQIAQKCQIYVGTYSGTGASSRTINIGFTPKAVLILQSGTLINGSAGSFGALAVSGHTAQRGNGSSVAAIVTNGFTVYQSSDNDVFLNQSGTTYYYLALR